ncbi:MAG: hypothetical protein ACRDOO_27355 [Actinomadura sp.]
MSRPAIIAGLAALTVSACSGSNTAPVAPPPTLDPSVQFQDGPRVSPGLETPGITSPTPAQAATTAKPGTAVTFVLPADVRQAVGDVYYEATKSTVGKGRTRDMVIGPNRTFYGAVLSKNTRKHVFWVIGDTGYTGVPASQQKGPHVWRKVGRGSIGWTYLGDTGGNPCSKVPMALIKVWDVRDLCPK